MLRFHDPGHFWRRLVGWMDGWVKAFVWPQNRTRAMIMFGIMTSPQEVDIFTWSRGYATNYTNVSTRQDDIVGEKKAPAISHWNSDSSQETLTLSHEDVKG
jgi:hypothetical protein